MPALYISRKNDSEPSLCTDFPQSLRYCLSIGWGLSVRYKHFGQINIQFFFLTFVGVLLCLFHNALPESLLLKLRTLCNQYIYGQEEHVSHIKGQRRYTLWNRPSLSQLSPPFALTPPSLMRSSVHCISRWCH